VNGDGFLTEGSLRLFFFSYFGEAFDALQSTCESVDSWINGRQTGPQKFDGIPSHFFVGPARARKQNFASLLRKVTRGQVSVFVDQMVGYVMTFADPVKKRLTEGVGFAQFMAACPKYIAWLQNIATPWMEAQSERSPAEVSVADIGLDMLVAPESVGRDLQSVVQEAREVKRKNVITFSTNGPGSLWWASFIKTRNQGGRSILRPRTQFDRIQLSELKAVIDEELADIHQAWDKTGLETLLRQKLGINNSLMVERIYNIFDTNQDGSLTSAEIATGLLLLCSGNAADRLRLAFEFFDVEDDNDMGRDELGQFLHALVALSKFCVSANLELLGELFGPSPTSAEGVRDAKDFGAKVNSVAAEQLEVTRKRLEGRLRRGYFVIIPPIFWFVWRIPIGSRNVSDE
jgi:Ca2+-binding EF-hand superfamily protein